MKSFYSLIKIAPNSLSDDNLTIGIIFSTMDDGFKIKISKNKISIAKSLISADGSIIDFFTKEINKKVIELNKIFSTSKSELFDQELMVNFNYFEYLSNYSNGILRFSSPQYITEKLTEISIAKLYSLFVDDKDVEEKKIKRSDDEFYHRINDNLIERIKDQVHTNIKINNKIVPTISTASFELDCIGLNGTLIGAKSLPFTSSREVLSKNVNTFTSVIAHLSKLEKKSLDNINFYLIADKPEDLKSDEYKYWHQLNKSESIFTVLPSDEAELVADEIKRKKAHKFLEIVE